MSTSRPLVAASAVLLAAACTGPFGDSPEEHAANAARDFLVPWAAGDVAAAAAATDSAREARDLLTQVRDDLQITSTAYELSAEATCGPRRCTQPVTLTHPLAGMGRWSYRSAVVVARPADDTADGFRVAWSPRIVHPRLTEQTGLSRVRELAPRASILDRDGRPLTRNREVFKVGVVPRELGPDTYAALHSLLDIDPAGLRASVEAAEPDWFVPVITLRTDDYRPVDDRLLQRDAVSLGEPAQCPSTTTVSGKSFKNYDDFQPLPPDGTFADAFAASCNTAVVSRAGELDDQALHETAAGLGLGAEWALGVDAFSGSVPTTVDEVDRAASMIGQGRVLTSPLAMAMVAAAVDSGRPAAPTLLADEQAVPAADTAYEPLPDDLVRSLRALMRLVVTQGTGTELDLAGEPVHAKTGTAEFDSDDPSKTHAWMIGFRGDLAFAVLVENGESGSHDAAPVARTFLESLPAG
jgi:hypothetical protein